MRDRWFWNWAEVLKGQKYIRHMTLEIFKMSFRNSFKKSFGKTFRKSSGKSFGSHMERANWEWKPSFHWLLKVGGGGCNEIIT